MELKLKDSWIKLLKEYKNTVLPYEVYLEYGDKKIMKAFKKYGLDIKIIISKDKTLNQFEGYQPYSCIVKLI